MDISTATPVEIDTEIARLWEIRYGHLLKREQAWLRVGSATTRLLRAQGVLQGWWNTASEEQIRNFLSEHSEISEDVEMQVEAYGDAQTARQAREVWDAYGTYLDHDAQADEALMDTEPLEAEWERRGRWNRAYLVVTNGTGHVHRSMHCSTCYPTTRYHWMVDYSDRTEDLIVAAAGERACTVCYPSAPVGVKGTSMFTPDEVEAQRRREERAAAKAERDAAKITLTLWVTGRTSRNEVPTPYAKEITWKTARALQNDTGALVRKINGCWAMINGFDLEMDTWNGQERVQIHRAEAEHNLQIMLAALAERGVDTEALVVKNVKRAEKER